MGIRNLILGTAAVAAIAAIVVLAFRSDRTSSVAANPDITVSREIRTMPAEASFPQSGNGAEPVAPLQSSEPDDSLSHDYAKQSSRVLTPKQLETRWNAEARDESWAAAFEMALGDYLARQPQPNALGSPSVECRATLCRVATSVDATVFQAAPNADLQAAMGGIQHESLGRELVPVAEGIVISPEHPDQITMSAYLQRSDRPGESRP